MKGKSVDVKRLFRYGRHVESCNGHDSARRLRSQPPRPRAGNAFLIGLKFSARLNAITGGILSDGRIGRHPTLAASAAHRAIPFTQNVCSVRPDLMERGAVAGFRLRF